MREIRNDDALPIAMLLAIGGQLNFGKLSEDMARIVGEMQARRLADKEALERVTEAAKLVGRVDRLGIGVSMRRDADAVDED